MLNLGYWIILEPRLLQAFLDVIGQSEQAEMLKAVYLKKGVILPLCFYNYALFPVLINQPVIITAEENCHMKHSSIIHQNGLNCLVLHSND